jgi:hypothetical protein
VDDIHLLIGGYLPTQWEIITPSVKANRLLYGRLLLLWKTITYPWERFSIAMLPEVAAASRSHMGCPWERFSIAMLPEVAAASRSHMGCPWERFSIAMLPQVAAASRSHGASQHE